MTPVTVGAFYCDGRTQLAGRRIGPCRAGDGLDVRRVLLDGGLYVPAGSKARGLLTTYLASVHVEVRAKAVASTGWFGAAFVLPDGAIGAAGDERDQWGSLAVEFQWTPGDLFDVPRDRNLGGLIWFLNGEAVRALWPEYAVTTSGRNFDRLTRAHGR